MKLEKRKNTKRSIFYGGINRVITLLMPFAVQTATIRTLGMDYVGIRGLFSSILTVLSLAELGVGSAIVFSMYKPIAEDDTDTICALLNLYRKVYRYIGCAILFLGICLTPFVEHLIKGDYPSELNLHLVFWLYLTNTVISYWMYAYRSSLLSAYQRMDVVSNIGTATTILMSIMQIMMLIIVRNFYLFLGVSICFTVIRNIITAAVTTRMFPEIKCEGNVPANIKENIKKNVAGLLISKVCGTTRNTFDNIFISMFIGLAQSGMYTNYFYVLTTLNGFTGIFQTSILAGVGNSIATESKEKNFKQMMNINSIYMLLGGWMAICMLCLYQPFMELWAGKKYCFSFGTMILFPIYFYIEKMGDIRSVYSNAAGLFWENRYRTIIEAILNVVLNYLFVIKWGTWGILMATIITLFILGFLGSTFVVFKYYFIDGMKDYLLSQAMYLGVTVFTAFVTYFCCTKILNVSVLTELLLRLVICLVIPPFCFFILLFKSREVREARHWFWSMVKR